LTGDGPAASPPQGGCRDATVNGDVGQVQTDHAVVGRQHQGVYPLRYTGPSPLGKPAPDRAIRTGGGGDPLVARTMHQRVEQMLEYHPIGNPPPVTAQGMRWVELGTFLGPDGGGELDPDRFEQR
jgi:hypothetical protein